MSVGVHIILYPGVHLECRIGAGIGEHCPKIQTIGMRRNGL